ncbi:hypothetical protein [Conexibacter sp. SYSU D00693]|uniref:hypothetical protein n=1 Tax=Conexibacter sp. SYSU D00693 TaxID=2812560 RepID=UPI00196A6962|nr:hypothetical protein [Conexibacter sp. SYSU D00693]
MRVAFVGQSTFFEACALADGVVPTLTTRFFEFRAGADAGRLRERLEAYDPQVVVVFRPEIIPSGTFDGLPVLTLGFLTEPLPRRAAPGQAGSNGVAHHDLERRLEELSTVDARQFDRVVAFDPHIATSAGSVLPVWRSLPLPVADRFYRDVGPAPFSAPRPLFVGRSTPHRERLLADSKHLHDVLHFAFGVGAGELHDVMGARDVGINLHNEPYPSFENRVCLHLAAGHLVLSEPLSPTHGLEPGVDFLEVHDAKSLQHALFVLTRFPETWHDVRVRGRRKAEQFRASRVWSRLLGDLHRDVRARGGRDA